MNSAPDTRQELRSTLLRNPVVRKALELLLCSHEYAEDLHSSRWDFSVDVAILAQAGCTPNDLRWLTEKGYAEYAGARTPSRRGRRLSRKNGGSRPETGLLLTEHGVSVARLLRAAGERASLILGADPCPQGAEASPRFRGNGELLFRGEMVKRFGKAVSDPRALVDAFQASGWLQEMEDPLPARPNGNAKKRLQRAVDNLNRGLNGGLRFYRTEAGRAVGWIISEP